MPPRNRYSLEHLFGNINIARNIFPRLTGHVRKSDPDGSSLVSYIPTLTGKILNLEYTREIAGVPTTFTGSVTFAANGFQAAIDQINLMDVNHVEASDLDGFMSIRNKNPGKTNYIQVNAASTAAPLFGFDQKPTPGFKSVAGEVASSPVDRAQRNPTGTGGISRDESLEGSSLNRALAAFGDIFARLMREQDREVGGFAETLLAPANLFILTGKVAIKFSPVIAGMRLPINAFPDASIPSQPGMGRLGALFRLQTANGEEVILSNKDVPRINRVLWGNPATVSAFNDTQAFSVYTPLASPTAFSIYGTGPGGPPAKLTKLAPVAINEIRGNVLKCGGSPAFQSGGLVYPGDTAKITLSTATSPFSHNGEFIIDEIIDDNTIALRPKSKNDPLADPIAEAPPGLNQGTAGMGSVEVLVGQFLNGAGIIIMTDCPAAFIGDLNGVVLRYVTGVRYKEANSDKFARTTLGGIRSLVSKLISVSPFSGGFAHDGANYVGAGDNFDASLSEGTVRDQLDQLSVGWAALGRENNFVITQHMQGGLADDSAALATTAAPAVRKLLWTLDNGVNPKVRLYFYSESGNTGIEATVNARWNPVTARFVADVFASQSVMVHVDNRSAELLVRASSETNPFTYPQFGHTIASIKTFGAGFQTWKLLEKGGVLIGDVNSASTFPRIGVNRATAEETLAATAAIRTLVLVDEADTAPAFPGTKSLARFYLVPAEIGASGGFGSYQADAWEMTFNAQWIPEANAWQMDDPTTAATVMTFDPTIGIQIKKRHLFGPTWTAPFDNALFADVMVDRDEDQSVPGPTGFNQMSGLSTSLELDATGPINKNLMNPKQVPKCWAYINFSGPGSKFAVDGFNVFAVTLVGTEIRVAFTQNLVISTYAVFVDINLYIGASSLNVTARASNINPDYVALTFEDTNTGAVVDPFLFILATFSVVIYGSWESPV